MKKDLRYEVRYLREQLNELEKKGEGSFDYYFEIGKTSYEVRVIYEDGLYKIILLSINGKPFLKDCYYNELTKDDVIRILVFEKEDYFDEEDYENGEDYLEEFEYEDEEDYEYEDE